METENRLNLRPSMRSLEQKKIDMDEWGGETDGSLDNCLSHQKHSALKTERKASKNSDPELGTCEDKKIIHYTREMG